MDIYKNAPPLGSTFDTPIEIDDTVDTISSSVQTKQHSGRKKCRWDEKSLKQSDLTINARRKGDYFAPGYVNMPKDKAFWVEELEDFYPFFKLDHPPYPQWFENEFPRATRDNGFLIFDSSINEVMIWSKAEKEWKLKY